MPAYKSQPEIREHCLYQTEIVYDMQIEQPSFFTDDATESNNKTEHDSSINLNLPTSGTTYFPLNTAPLAHIARPYKFEDFKGQEHIFKRYPFLRERNFPSVVFWGPPGIGKTTLAHILAQNSGKDIYPFSPVMGGVAELKKLIHSAIEVKKTFNRESIIFIDEIHRFNKGQQDALLPYVENGSFTLIGATTENPRRSINNALLSRTQIIELKALSEDSVLEILERVNGQFEIGCAAEIVKFIADHSGGDAGRALNALDILYQKQKESSCKLSLVEVRGLILENARNYDRNQDRHYDVISAFIKSLRGSDPQAALLWLAVMLDGGEDPVFIARRLVIFASEDIGNADIHAISLATSVLLAVQNIGMPEARINLAQAATYLASTVKSNAVYEGISRALEYVQNHPNIAVPGHLKNRPPAEFLPEGKLANEAYKYPHSYPNNFIRQKYSNEGKQINDFYRPTENGHEKNLKRRLDSLWN